MVVNTMWQGLDMEIDPQFSNTQLAFRGANENPQSQFHVAEILEERIDAGAFSSPHPNRRHLLQMETLPQRLHRGLDADFMRGAFPCDGIHHFFAKQLQAEGVIADAAPKQHAEGLLK